MSAIGAVTGAGSYSELAFKGRKFKLSQWTLAAMDSVSTAAYLKAAHACRMMGGTDKAVANREVALSRTFALGGFGFDSIVDDGGLDGDAELLATFLWNLLTPYDATISYELAAEMVKAERASVVTAISHANPLKAGQKTESSVQPQSELPTPSNVHGNHSVTAGETTPT